MLHRLRVRYVREAEEQKASGAVPPNEHGQLLQARGQIPRSRGLLVRTETRINTRGASQAPSMKF